MASEYKFGVTEPSMKASGKATELTVEENFGISTEITSKVNGKTIKPAERGSTFIPMEPDTKVIG
jgi:hypothetical protein